jgi:glycoprotein 3-alpha-L-fucosyltransferase
VGRAHESGYEVVMTPRLDAEVSCVYFGWAKWEDTFFNPMKFPPVPAKDKADVAVAFISNCGARAFRLHALEALQAQGITVHSRGRCANNMPNANKDDLLPTTKFSLAFENSIELDYVTEKYLQALNFGAVPVVIGAPNIQDFAPSDNSLIYIPDEDVRVYSALLCSALLCSTVVCEGWGGGRGLG